MLVAKTQMKDVIYVDNFSRFYSSWKPYRETEQMLKMADIDKQATPTFSFNHWQLQSQLSEQFWSLFLVHVVLHVFSLRTPSEWELKIGLENFV